MEDVVGVSALTVISVLSFMNGVLTAGLKSCFRRDMVNVEEARPALNDTNLVSLDPNNND